MKTLITIAGLLIGLMAVWLLFSREQAEYAARPVTELPTTRLIDPEEWVGIANQGGFEGTGWVLLPKPQTGSEFESDVRPASRGFLPPNVCGECHQENYQGFLSTAHASTSAEPDQKTILGSFDSQRNVLKSGNPELWFSMTAEGEKFYQELHIQNDSGSYKHRRSIDLVLGSGNHGQSYLNWEGDRLYQMHVSYLTELDQWVNSPGIYIDGTADFARPVPGRCLDCHATWFAEDSQAINRFDKHHYLLGVTCVRCHGPGHEHVSYHREFPNATEGKRIVNPSQLTQQRLNELCAQCHSAGEPIAPAFSYRPGEPLAEYLQLNLSADDPGNEDPHSANQLARLMKSACYQKGEMLTCISCHDPHRDQRGMTGEFSRSCLKCHSLDACGEHQELGTSIENRCVECHMPSRRDAQVSVEMTSGTVTALIRDHYIGVWPEVSDRIRKQILDLSDTSNQNETKLAAPSQGAP